MADYNYTKDFTATLVTHTDIPPIFIKYGTKYLTAITLGRFYKLYDFGGMRPNVYTVLASAPRFTRRGELMRCINVVRNSAFKTYCEKIKVTDYPEEINAHSLGGGSPQGLVDDINYLKNRGATSFSVQSTEFGRIIQSMQRGAGYMSGLDDMYCILWTGERFYEGFSRRSTKDKSKTEPRILEEGTYFNVLGTMQKAKTYIESDKLSLKGTMRRLSFGTVEGKDVVDYYKPALGRNVDTMYNDDLPLIGRKLGIQMQKAYQDPMTLTELTYTDEAKDYFNKYDKKLTTMAKENDEDPYYLYQQGLFEQTLKFSMLDVIADNRTVINIEDAKQGKEDAATAVSSLKTILDDNLIPRKQKERRKNLDRMVAYVKKYNPTGRELQIRMARYGIIGKDFTEFKESRLIRLCPDGKYVVVD